MGGSKIIFAGPSKVFTRANKEQQRESSHAVYSLYNSDILGKSVNYNVDGELRFDSNSKIKTSPLMKIIELSGGDNAVNLIVAL